MNAISSTVTYGDHTIDLTSLPEVSIASLVRKGLSHFLGNEQASKVTEWKKQLTDKGTPPTEAEVAAYKADRIREAVAALASGTVGASSPRPRGSALETIMRAIAEKQVRAVLKGIGVTMPSGDKTVSFPDGQGGENHFTRLDLINRRLANPAYGPKIKSEAEKEMAAQERLAAKAVAEAGEGRSVEALGL